MLESTKEKDVIHIKGTGLRDGFQKCWLKLTYIGLNKGGMVFKFFDGTSDF